MLRAVTSVGYYGRTITKKLFKHDIFFLASGLAFNCILTMIPLFLLTAAAVGWFMNSSGPGLRQLNDMLDALIPPQPFAANIKHTILNIIGEMVKYRTPLGLVGVPALIWTATSLFDALRTVLHTINETKSTKTFLMSLVQDIWFVFFAFALLVASNIAIWAFSIVEALTRAVPGVDWVMIQSYTRPSSHAIVILLTACMFYLVYRRIPDVRPPKSAALVSTITTTAIWIASGRVFTIYLTNYSDIGTLYGPYGFLLVLLLWIYYSSFIFVVGGIVGQTFWERQKSRHPRRNA
jgi:membrane protein